MDSEEKKLIEAKLASGGVREREKKKTSKRRSGAEQRGAPLAEEGDGGEDGEREQVTVDAEDHMVDADVEDGLGDQDVVAAVGEHDQDHPAVRPPRRAARHTQQPPADHAPPAPRRRAPLEQRRHRPIAAGSHLHPHVTWLGFVSKTISGGGEPPHLCYQWTNNHCTRMVFCLRLTHTKYVLQ